MNVKWCEKRWWYPNVVSLLTPLLSHLLCCCSQSQSSFQSHCKSLWYRLLVVKLDSVRLGGCVSPGLAVVPRRPLSLVALPMMWTPTLHEYSELLGQANWSANRAANCTANWTNNLTTDTSNSQEIRILVPFFKSPICRILLAFKKKKHAALTYKETTIWAHYVVCTYGGFQMEDMQSWKRRLKITEALFTKQQISPVWFIGRSYI